VFLAVNGRFAPGDTLAITFGLTPWLDPLNDNRTEYANVAAVMYGPLLLAGLTQEATFALLADGTDVAKWLVVSAGMRFSAPGNWSLLPLNQVVDQPYTAYFNISTTATG
jgi:hypothetical protein